ncbi:MAG: hypothetical protein ACYTF0_07825 [Planctomycetota bacterium]|jgi:hypothetical protein
MTPRSGLAMLRFLISVALTALALLLGWGVVSNWQRDADADGVADGFTLRVFDRQWWGAGREQAKPLVADAQVWAVERKRQIWGRGGLVDDAEAWFGANKGRLTAVSGLIGSATDGSEPASSEEPQPATAPLAPVAASGATSPGQSDGAALSPRRARLEERLSIAAELFANGVEHLRAAEPDGAEVDPVQAAAHLQDAVAALTQVDRLLTSYGALSEYADLPDHDPERLAEMQQLAERNRALLAELTP